MKNELQKRYGRLTVTKRAAISSDGQVQWHCRCDCGNSVIVRGGKLRSGHTKSCGCLQREKTGAINRRHGAAKDGQMVLEYRIWIEMRQRCNNPKANRYYTHGARGIKVCRRWDRYENFIADMGPRPAGCSLERRDNDGDYKPTNCYWATRTQQARNKRNTIRLTVNGVTKPLTQWCEELGYGRRDYCRIIARLKAGRTHEESLRPKI